MARDLSQDIRDRTFLLACNVSRLTFRLGNAPGVRRIADQLIRAGTSIGANLEEAKAASSRREFAHRVQISLQEARETHYWLRICAELKLVPVNVISPLIGETDQIARILATIVINTKRRSVASSVIFAFCLLNFALLISE